MKRRALLFWLPISLAPVVYGYGFDGYTACSKPFRTSKSKSEVPCDFKNQNWCTTPGSAYPWRAVKRFVFENHGLMRRMYGSERHYSVLRAEIESNDVNDYQNDPHAWGGYHESTLKRYEKPLAAAAATATATTAATAATAATTTPTTKSSAEREKERVTTSPEKPTESTTTATSTSATNWSLLNSTLTLANLSVTETTYVTETDDLTTQTGFETTTNAVDNETSTLRTEENEPKPQIFQETTEELPLYKLRGINACPVKEEFVAPFWANNTRGEVLALLNLYPFEQYVHWERCTNENERMFCRQGCRCEQQYRLHRLLAYDPSNDCRGIFSDWFKFPSCCVCRCYDIPNELRITSRSPRERKPKIPKPDWFQSN